MDKSCFFVFWYLPSKVVGAEKLAIEGNPVLPLCSQDSSGIFQTTVVTL